MTDKFVDFQDVWLAYNEELLAQNHFAVEAIDLSVRQGEFIAIVGPSGCGKSTFMKLTTGLKMPSRGKILIDGQPVTGPLKISGMAFQAPSLLPWRTTVDNVLLPLEIVEPYRSQFKDRRKEYEERAKKLLTSVGLGGMGIGGIAGHQRASFDDSGGKSAVVVTSRTCWTPRTFRNASQICCNCTAWPWTSRTSID